MPLTRHSRLGDAFEGYTLKAFDAQATVLELAGQAGIPALETPLAPYDLYTADECFLTGTGAELIPVAEVDGRAMAACISQTQAPTIGEFNSG